MCVRLVPSAVCVSRVPCPACRVQVCVDGEVAEDGAGRRANGARSARVPDAIHRDRTWHADTAKDEKRTRPHEASHENTRASPSVTAHGSGATVTQSSDALQATLRRPRFDALEPPLKRAATTPPGPAARARAACIERVCRRYILYGRRGRRRPSHAATSPLGRHENGWGMK